MNIARSFIWMVLFVASASFLFSVEEEKSLGVQFAYYPANHAGGDGAGFNAPNYQPLVLPVSFTPLNGDSGHDLGSVWGGLELQVQYSQSLTYPFLQGQGALTKDNNLKMKITTGLSPVTLNIETIAVLTPIAFLKFEAGVHMGTGWHLLFNGLGLNEDGTGNPAEDSFSGVVGKGWLMGTFQFDLEALWPGDTHHYVVSTSHKVSYQHFSGARKEEAWQYLADDGQNFNGFLYDGNYTLGYQMPGKRINFVGFLADTSRNLGSVASLSPLEQGGWGSDFTYINMGPLTNIAFSKGQSMIVLLQFKNSPVYTEESIYYNYFKNREATGESYWYFNRLALVYNLSL